MRIGVDARPLQNDNRYRGIGRYTEFLLRALAAVAPERYRFVLYVDEGEPIPAFGVPRLDSAPRIGVPPDPATEARFLRRFVSLLATARPTPAEVDCFIQTDPWGGIPSRVPAIAVFHDAIPLIFRQRVRLVGPGDLRPFVGNVVDHRRLLSVLRRYRQAAFVVTISQSARADYLRLIHPGSERVRLIGSAPMSLHLGTRDRARLDRWALGDCDYLLYVGGVDPRKNVVQLLHDLQRLHTRHPDLKLVVVGKEFTSDTATASIGWSDQLRSHPELNDSVVVTGFIDDATLGALYAHAAAFVFPSRYEGFGLPVLEAMTEDCPVICYDNSAMPEVAGDAALVVPDGEPMAPAVERLLADPDLRASRVAAGRQQAAAFSWDDVAARMLAVLAEAEARPRQRDPIAPRIWEVVRRRAVTWYARQPVAQVGSQPSSAEGAGR